MWTNGKIWGVVSGKAWVRSALLNRESDRVLRISPSPISHNDVQQKEGRGNQGGETQERGEEDCLSGGQIFKREEKSGNGFDEVHLET